MMLDTDFFKQVNDRHGHQVGDEVLVKIGEILKGVVRKEDYVGRYGGEEFLLVLDNLSEKEVIKVCKRIKKALSESHFETKKDAHIKVTVSGGFYTCNEYTLNFKFLFFTFFFFILILILSQNIIFFSIFCNYIRRIV